MKEDLIPVEFNVGENPVDRGALNEKEEEEEIPVPAVPLLSLFSISSFLDFLRPLAPAPPAISQKSNDLFTKGLGDDLAELPVLDDGVFSKEPSGVIMEGLSMDLFKMALYAESDKDNLSFFT